VLGSKVEPDGKILELKHTMICGKMSEAVSEDCRSSMKMGSKNERTNTQKEN
jgi:hypothetical protein